MRSAHLAHGLTCLNPSFNASRHGRGSLVVRQAEQLAPSEDLDELFSYDVAVLDTIGLEEIPAVNGSVTRWEAGLIPRPCAEVVQGTAVDDPFVGGECRLEELEVYNVTYPDCREPWVICRCSDAADNFATVVNDLGQLPVAARDYVRHVVLSPDYELEGSAIQGLSLYTEGDLVIYGNWSSVSLFVHEVTHTLDYWVAGNGEESYSETEQWRDIVDNGTCVPDSYSKATYSETYAQAATMVLYDLNVDPMEEVVDTTCMVGIMDEMTDQLGDFLTYYEDATCSNRFQAAEVWCLRDGRAGPCESDDDSEDNNTNESSATPSLPIGSLPMAVFRVIAQVMRACGIATSR